MVKDSCLLTAAFFRVVASGTGLFSSLAFAKQQQATLSMLVNDKTSVFAKLQSFEEKNLSEPLNPAEVQALDKQFDETLGRYRSVMKDRKAFLLKNPAIKHQWRLV